MPPILCPGSASHIIEPIPAGVSRLAGAAEPEGRGPSPGMTRECVESPERIEAQATEMESSSCRGSEA